MKGIMILGSSGAGKTTLGRFTAQKLGVPFLDVDDYIWRKDTEMPFQVMYSREEKISRLMAAAREAEEFVMAGSMDSFHEYFDPFFRLAVYLTADQKHEAWLRGLSCPVLRLDGGRPCEENAEAIICAYRKTEAEE